MIKIKMITMGYCKAETLALSMKKLYETKSPETEIEHYFVYHYYPINEAENKIRLKEIADKYGLIWLDPGKNLGNTVGHNWAQDNHIHAEDYLFGFDPDNCPKQEGWDLALYKVITHPKIGWAALSCDATPNEVAGRQAFIKEENINGVNCYLCNTPMMLSIGVIDYSWVRDAGGMLPLTNFYGGTEIFMWPYLKNKGLELAILKDFKDSHEIKNATTDPIYHQWKTMHTFGGDPRNFDRFLEDLGFNRGMNQHMNTWEFYSEFMSNL
jgi:hypothetical protein